MRIRNAYVPGAKRDGASFSSMKPNVHISSKDPEKLKHAHAVREEVFHKEQGISKELDFDAEDANAIHFIAYIEDKPVGTARIRFPYSPDQAKMERLAVLSEMRGKKIGEHTIKEIEAYLIAEGIDEIILNSQLSAKGFYERFGYIPSGDVFDEANIPHVKMMKRLKK